MDVMRPPLPLRQKIRRSLILAWWEGIPAAFMIAVVDYYLIPLGLFLGASTQQIGLLVSLPHLLGALALLASAKGVEWSGSRVRFVTATAALQATLLLPAAAMALLPARAPVALLIGLFVLFRVLFNLTGPAWGSLVSQYLPETRRGRYFGRRARLVGVTQLAGIALAGGLLSWISAKGSLALGFFLLFLTAALSRLLSSLLLARLVDLPLSSTEKSTFTFWEFIRRFQESNFVKFTLYVSAMTFAAHLAAPYFSVYMLRDLRFSYASYMAVHLAAALAGLISLPLWGKHADWVGNVKILKMTGWVVPFVPLLWLVSTNPLYLMLVDGVAGFAWGGFNLCATNFIYDAVAPEKRVRCLAYFNLINGIGIFAGTALGGWLAEHLPPLLGVQMFGLFALSGTFRLLAHLALVGKFSEVRASSRKVPSLPLFFSVVGLRPLLGRAQEAIFPSTKK